MDGTLLTGLNGTVEVVAGYSSGFGVLIMPSMRLSKIEERKS